VVLRGKVGFDAPTAELTAMPASYRRMVTVADCHEASLDQR
jgi:hypothetical protein